MNEYRHACLKDLEHYFKIEDYFGGLSIEECNLIKSNLGITSVISDTYEKIKQLHDSRQLNPSSCYIITDFQTIYKSNTGDIWGLNTNPSKVYRIRLSPVTKYMFSPQVYILDENNNLFEAKYDITSELLTPTIRTKGKITYLKDSNGNSAYYDFKNIKYRIILSPDIDVRLSEPIDVDVFTFNIPTSVPGRYIEGSKQCYDNQLGRGCWQNIFLNKCENVELQSNSCNNLFIGDILNVSGKLSNSVVQNLFSEEVLSIQFLTLSSQNQNVAIKTHLTGDKIMFDVITLDKNVYSYV